MPEDGGVPSKLRTNLAAAWIMLIVLAVGLLLMLGSFLWEDKGLRESGVAITRELGALLVTTATLSVLWDLRARRALTREILEAAGLSRAIERAGLSQVSDFGDVDWATCFHRARRIDLFFIYAHSWRADHHGELRAFVRKDGARLRVILPDPADAALVAQLALKLGYTEEVLCTRIREARDALTALAADAAPSATVEVRFTREFPVFSHYRFDDLCVTAMYAQTRGRVENLPAFVALNGGRLFGFFTAQFDSLWAAAPSDAGATISG